MSNLYPEIPPSGIGEAAKYNFSPWFIKLRFQDESPIKGRNWNEATKPLSTVQSRIGNEFEERIYNELETEVREHIQDWYDWGDKRNKEKLIEKIREYSVEDYDKPAMMTQVRLSGEIGAFEITGDSDLVILFPTQDGVRIQVIDIKSSWEEKPSQQLQTATYTNLIRQSLCESDFNYEIYGGVVFRDTEVSSILKPSETPTFHTETREGDVERILQEGGPFTKAFNNSFDEIPLTIKKDSPYAEVTVVEALEKGDISILGVTPGEKQKLKSYGISSITDLAELYEPFDDPKPFEYDEPSRNPDKSGIVEDIVQNSGISSRLSVLSQKAQAILGVFKPDSKYAHDKPWMPWISGSGNGDLPEDDPPYETQLPIKRDSMIRIYLDIQHDHVRDEIVALSGVVTSGLYNGDPLTFSDSIDKIDREPSSWKDESESDLINSGVSDMYETIKFLADFAGHGKNTALHFYIYDRNSYEKLYESVKRHEESSETVSSFRDLLDMREGVDQKMVSIVQDEIENRMAVKDVDTSIQSIVQRMYPNNDKNKVEEDDWFIKDSDGNKVDLREAYKQYMFDNSTPISYSEGEEWNAEVLNRYENKEYDSFYNVAPRSGSQIPIEYLWASNDIGMLDTEWSESSRQESIIENFMWVSKDKNNRMSSEYFSAMSRVLSKSLLHIERSIAYRNADIHKDPINIAEMSDEKPENSNLGSACLDYLDLESQQTRSDALEVYAKPLKKRVVDGDSIPIEITGVRDDRGYMFEVEGRILLDDMGFDNPIEVAGSSNIKGSDSTTGGSRCVATPLVRSKEGFEVAVDSPKQAESSVKVSVEEYNPEDQKVVIKGYRASRKGENRYVKSRKPWTLDAGERSKSYVGPGEAFVLDPSPDSMMAEKSIKALNNIQNNKVYKDINQFRSNQSNCEESDFNSENIQDYIDWIKPHVDFIPNRKQRKFIKETSEYSLLQGPPGTGKTSGAISHSVMSRAYDLGTQGRQLTALVSGLSNKSIDEVMEDISDIKSLADSSFGSHPLENTRIIRLSYSRPSDPVDGVEYLNYRNEQDIEILRNIISSSSGMRQKTLGNSNETEHVIVFATPGRVDGLVSQLDPERTAEEVYQDADNIFDLLVVDEGSMMPMYQLFMTSAFLKESGSQVLIGGDHRQLPPVQKYDWSDERRNSIEKYLPHLSCLDYFRYLKGEDVENVLDDSPKSPEVQIPIVRLQKTYRCHSVVTDFLRSSVYEKDRIDYYSDQKETISSSDVSKGKIREFINPDSPITLVIHDDRSSQQVNVIEEQMISSIMDGISDKYSKGIVTPHNAQKGRLRVSCSDSDVDTVERFQGGEKDIMVVSTTVSDPDHLSKEEEFILSENRLNVALSRMKKKLIVVASKSIFEMVPDDTETYEQARIWKSLYSEAHATGTPEWEGKLSEVVETPIDENIEVYNIENVS